jgi:hypothetical protein
MKARAWKRHRTQDALRGVGRLIGVVVAAFAVAWLDRRRRRAIRVERRVPETADERTFRRIAEQQAGGISSQEGSARYERGENPGGLHHKAQRLPPDAEEFEIEEPPDRLETNHGSRRRAMSATRR